MLESDLKKLNSLDEDYRVASAMYRERLDEIEQRVVKKIIKEGALAGKKFHFDAKNRKLVYQGYKEIHPLLTKVLDIQRSTMVKRIHWRIAAFGNRRFSDLTISTGKATVQLPEDLTKKEFDKILEITGITDIDQWIIDWELDKSKKRTDLCKIIKEFAS
jgi:hypothetical protein